MRQSSKKLISIEESAETGEMKENVYLLLKKMIMNREFTPNERIDAYEIANKLGISRTPVRDALNKLDNEGFIVTMPRKGTFITGIFKKDLVELFQFRMMIELFMLDMGFSGIVRNAALIEAQIERWEAELKQEKYDASVFLESDVLIHKLIVGAGNNDRILKSYEGLNCHVQTARGYCLQDKGRILAAHAEHKAILEGILNNDREQTRLKLKDHLENTLNSLLGMIEIFKVF